MINRLTTEDTQIALVLWPSSTDLLIEMTHVKKIAWGNQQWVDYFWFFFLVSGKTDYDRLEMQKIIDSAWFSIKIDVNRLKSNWWSSIMLEIDFNRLKRNWFSSVMLGTISNRWFCHWLSWILLKILRNQSVQHWRTSDERQYFNKQHWWNRFSHPCLTSFSRIWNKGTPRPMMSHCLIRDRHALISALSMVSLVFPIFSSADKPHVDEYSFLAEWSLGLGAI